MIHAAMMGATRFATWPSASVHLEEFGALMIHTLQHGLQLLDEELPRSMTNSRCRIVPCSFTV